MNIRVEKLFIHKLSLSLFLSYAQKKKKHISINIEIDTIAYFKILAKKVGIPYQNLINSYLTDCAIKRVEPRVKLF
jgi:predicted DNA binding CopG/RHH family protein